MIIWLHMVFTHTKKHKFAKPWILAPWLCSFVHSWTRWWRLQMTRLLQQGDSTRDMGERHEATMVSNYPTKCINRYKYSKNNARVINVITDMHVIYVYMKYIKILWDTISAHIAWKSLVVCLYPKNMWISGVPEGELPVKMVRFVFGRILDDPGFFWKWVIRPKSTGGIDIDIYRLVKWW